MLRLNNKAMASLALAAIIAFSFSALPSFAASTITSAEFVIGMNQYFVNDQTPGISMDAAPYIDANSGRTLVPVRYLGDALGAQTAWDGNTQTVAVTSGSTNISLVIGNTTMNANGKAQTLDQAPVIKDGRTYLPARWVANALGYSVDWNAANKIVLIWPNGTTEPDYSNVISQAQQASQQSVPGYTIPAGTQVTINSSATDPGKVGQDVDIEVVLHMIGVTESISQQVNDLQNILSQHLDQDAVQQIMVVVNQKIAAGANSPIVDKWFKLDGKSESVLSDSGDIYVAVGSF